LGLHKKDDNSSLSNEFRINHSISFIHAVPHEIETWTAPRTRLWQPRGPDISALSHPQWAERCCRVKS